MRREQRPAVTHAGFSYLTYALEDRRSAVISKMIVLPGRTFRFGLATRCPPGEVTARIVVPEG